MPDSPLARPRRRGEFPAQRAVPPFSLVLLPATKTAIRRLQQGRAHRAGLAQQEVVLPLVGCALSDWIQLSPPFPLRDGVKVRVYSRSPSQGGC